MSHRHWLSQLGSGLRLWHGSEFPLLFVLPSVAERPCHPMRPGLPQSLPKRTHQGRAGPRVRRPVVLRGCGQCIAVRFLTAARKMNAKHCVILNRIVAFLGAGVNYLNARYFQA